MRSASERRFLLATRSAAKLREIREILHGPHEAAIVSLVDIGHQESAAEANLESYPTFIANALAKAEYFLRTTGIPTLADDSGLVVDALSGRPGVHSKRFSGRADLSGADLDTANNLALLDAMRGVQENDRTAHYVCAAALLDLGRPPVFAVGTVTGSILTTPRGAGGFGYDPLFFLAELERTFGEVDSSTKHRSSHRGRAFRALLDTTFSSRSLG